MNELTPEELRDALNRADRGLRLPWVTLLIGGAVSAATIAIAQKFIDLGNPTHVLILCASLFLYTQFYLIASLIVSRLNAANARMLRALELMDEALRQR